MPPPCCCTTCTRWASVFGIPPTHRPSRWCWSRYWLVWPCCSFLYWTAGCITNESHHATAPGLQRARLAGHAGGLVVGLVVAAAAGLCSLDGVSSGGGLPP